MAMFTRLSTCLPGIDSPEKCVRSFMTDDEGSTMVLRSIQPYDFNGLKHHLEDQQSTVSQIQGVLEKLYVALDTAIWSLDSGFGDLLSHQGSASHRSMLLCSDLYVRHWATKGSSDGMFTQCTPSEILEYNHVKNNTLLSLFRFTSLQIKLNSKDPINHKIINQQYLELVLTSMLSPHILGSTINDTDQISHTRSIAAQIITHIHESDQDGLLLDVLKRSIEEVMHCKRRALKVSGVVSTRV